MFYTYILRSENNNSYYVGSCKDLYSRLNLHNKGLVFSIKRYVPWKIVYSETYKTLSMARRREIQIKSWKKREVIEKLLS